MNEEIKKKVDEDWKKQIEKEKQEHREKQETFHEPSFTILISSLSMQAMIAMGKLENPLTGKTEENLQQARFLIDTLGILKEKTRGNLTPEEENFLNDSLFHLRMNYVEAQNLKSKGL